LPAAEFVFFFKNIDRPLARSPYVA